MRQIVSRWLLRGCFSPTWKVCQTWLGKGGQERSERSPQSKTTIRETCPGLNVLRSPRELIQTFPIEGQWGAESTVTGQPCGVGELHSPSRPWFPCPSNGDAGTYLTGLTRCSKLARTLKVVFKKCVCVWLHRVLVVTCELFSCGMWTLSCSVWNLGPWTGIEPGPPVLGVQSLSHWAPREVLESVFLKTFYKLALFAYLSETRGNLEKLSWYQASPYFLNNILPTKKAEPSFSACSFM